MGEKFGFLKRELSWEELRLVSGGDGHPGDNGDGGDGSSGGGGEGDPPSGGGEG